MSSIKVRVALISLLATTSLVVATLPASAASDTGPTYCFSGTKVRVWSNARGAIQHRVAGVTYGIYGHVTPGYDYTKTSATTGYWYVSASEEIYSAGYTCWS